MTYRQMFKKLEAMPDECLDAEVRILTQVTIPAFSEILPSDFVHAHYGPFKPFLAILQESEITK